MDKLTTCLESTPPHKICFTTFTKAAAQEAIDRALIKNPELSEKDFTAFSTLHALCFRRIPRKQMLNYQDYKLLGELLGYSISGVATLFDYKSDSGNGKGDRLLQYESLMRNLQEPASSVLATQVNTKFTPEELEKFYKFYRNFREEKNKYDFTDQLEVFLESKIKLNVDYLFVDEAQDLSPLQWKIIDHISNEVKEVIIVGDDKQSIFKFAGGDPKSLIHKEGTRVVLDTSYRLPKNVLEYAESVANRIKEK
jgi:DNA helicase-2/ATP-dependent DNA helicase PcrA